MDYEKEYGRYKKKVEDQQKEIEKLREQVQAVKQVLDANNAIIAAILVETSSVRAMPMIVEQATINEALRGEYRLKSEKFVNEAGHVYHELWCEGPERMDGGCNG